MASPNTIKLMNERMAMRVGTVKTISGGEFGFNRAERRGKQRNARLRPKMRDIRRGQILRLKNPIPRPRPVKQPV